jgi:hypothetical protein
MFEMLHSQDHKQGRESDSGSTVYEGSFDLWGSFDQTFLEPIALDFIPM